MNEKLVVIIGPTAVGKTKLSIDVASHFNGEVISGDSMQIYKGMDIGTAKITKAEMKGIKHHLIDIKAPNEGFSAAEFKQQAMTLITELNQKQKLPIIAGGTGLYIQSVLYDYHFPDVVSNPELRLQLEKRATEEGQLALHSELTKVDPVSANRIHPNNVRRVIRALEIFYTTGKPHSNEAEAQGDSPYDFALIGLEMNREALYERINKRVDIMIEQGLFDEVHQLYKSGLKDCQSIQAIGYKEIFDYFDGKLSREAAIEQLKQNSRRYAKRQFTWFRNKMDVKWFDMTEAAENLAIYDKKKDEIFDYIAGKLRF